MFYLTRCVCFTYSLNRKKKMLRWFYLTWLFALIVVFVLFQSLPESFKLFVDKSLLIDATKHHTFFRCYISDGSEIA